MGLASAVWTQVLESSQNTLYLNDQWTVSKRMLATDLMGSDEFLLTRYPLAGNVLNLGAWHGFQEVKLRKIFDPTWIQFRFKLEKSSYLDFTYNEDGRQLSGLRLVGETAVPLAAEPAFSFEGNNEGAFVSKDPLLQENLSPQWHRATLLKTDSGILVKLDEARSIVIPRQRFRSGRIGFRGGAHSVFIKDLVVRDENGSVFKANFWNTQGWARNFLVHLALIFIFSAAISVIFPRKILFRVALVSLAVFCAGSIFFIFDYFYWSRLPFDTGMHPAPWSVIDQVNRPSSFLIERARYELLSHWSALMGGEPLTRRGLVTRGYPVGRLHRGPVICGPGLATVCHYFPEDDTNIDDRERPNFSCDSVSEKVCQPFEDRDPRIFHPKRGPGLMLVGSSQSVGAGADTLEHTFFVRLHRALNRELHGRLESLNISVSGATSLSLLKDYREKYLDYKPDLVVLNLSHNDSLESLREGVVGFLKLNRERGVRTVLIEEPNSHESITANSAKYAVMKSVGLEYGIPVLALNEFMDQSEVREAGIAWWDVVHMTTFGQGEAASWVAPRIIRFLQ